MKRGYFFLDDSNWQTANDYFNKALAADTEYAPAYIGRLCAELEIRHEDHLGETTALLSDINNYQNAFRFSDAENQEKLRKYDEIARKRYEKVQKAKVWFNNNGHFPLCWHCGGKLDAGLLGNYYDSPCKVCGKRNKECFLCGGEVNHKFVPRKTANSKCTKCGEDFYKDGFRF